MCVCGGGAGRCERFSPRTVHVYVRSLNALMRRRTIAAAKAATVALCLDFESSSPSALPRSFRLPTQLLVCVQRARPSRRRERGTPCRVLYDTSSTRPFGRALRTRSQFGNTANDRCGRSVCFAPRLTASPQSATERTTTTPSATELSVSISHCACLDCACVDACVFSLGRRSRANRRRRTPRRRAVARSRT